MRTTFILEVDPGLVDFIYGQPNFEDPSALINQVLRNEKNRLGFSGTKGQSQYDDAIHVAMEEFLDADIQAAD